MSKKSKIIWRGLELLFIITALNSFMACDPCRDLAEKMCNCKEEYEQAQCRNDLNLAKSHKFFESFKEPKLCEEAMKTCSCEKLLSGQDEKCGLYRDALWIKN